MRRELRDALVFEIAEQPHSLIGQLLRNEGFSLVSRATTLHDALTQTEAIGFDVAFIEVSLRVDWGFEFLRAIRFDRCGQGRRLPIVIVSADAHRSVIARARDAGAHGFVAKPFSRAAVSLQVARLTSAPRAWIESGAYAGPDRRRWQDPRYVGPERRGVADAYYVA